MVLGSRRCHCSKWIHSFGSDSDPENIVAVHAVAHQSFFDLFRRRKAGEPEVKTKEYLAGLDPSRKVRIGTNPGGGFIFVGYAGDALGRGIERSMQRKLLNRIYRRMCGMENTKSRQTLTSYFNRCFSCRGIENREILETYDGIMDDSTVIIIPGTERMVEYDERGPARPIKLEGHGVESLAAAIYREVCLDLIGTYRNGDTSKGEGLERWIDSDPYGILPMPEGIIKACRSRAKMKGNIKRKMI